MEPLGPAVQLNTRFKFARFTIRFYCCLAAVG